VLDPEILKNDSEAEAEAEKIINIGLLCTQFFPELQISMSEVVAMFLGRLDVDVLDEFYQSSVNVMQKISALYSGSGDPSLSLIEEDPTVSPLLTPPCSVASHVLELGQGR
jgi:hypothetical protein